MQDRIKQMAEVAGAIFDETFESVRPNPMYLLTPDELALFAQLVAEDCAKIASDAIRYNMEWMQNDGPYMTAQNAGPYVERDDVIEAIRARYGIKG